MKETSWAASVPTPLASGGSESGQGRGNAQLSYLSPYVQPDPFFLALELSSSLRNSLCSDPEPSTKGSVTCVHPALLEEASSILTVLGPRGSCSCHHMLPGQAPAQQMATWPSCTCPQSLFALLARSHWLSMGRPVATWVCVPLPTTSF